MSATIKIGGKLTTLKEVLYPFPKVIKVQSSIVKIVGKVSFS